MSLNLATSGLARPDPGRARSESALSSASANSVKQDPSLRPVERVDTTLDLEPHTRMQSLASLSTQPETLHTRAPDQTQKPTEMKLPTPPASPVGASATDLRSGFFSSVPPAVPAETLFSSLHADSHTIPLYAGFSYKRFDMPRDVLTTKVPHFRALLAHSAPELTAEQLTFPDIDEYAFALFVRWLYGGQLHGPRDFHSMQHYLCLYVLAHRFDIELLCNNVMDLVRQYYRIESMTAPAYRIEYIYSHTVVPNHMRNFLITTATYRCLCEAPTAPGVYTSDAIKAVLRKGGDAAVDFAEAVIELSRNGMVDVRRSSDCTFHEHSDGKLCEPVIREPYMLE